MKGILRSAVVGWAIICVLTLWPAFLPEPVYLAAAKVDKPLAEDGVRGEVPWEEQLIEAALIEQGYFRDDVPLSFELRTEENGFELRTLERPPQSWCYVTEL